MRLQDFRFLTDENVSQEVVKFLREEGYDVLDVKESSLIGSCDLTLIRISFTENRVVITHDSDFGKLAIASSEPIVGLIFLRPGHVRHEFTISNLRELFKHNLETV